MSFPDIHFTGRPVLAMPASQLHALYKLRTDVFVAEQRITEPEIEQLDAHPRTHHVLAYIHPGSGPDYPWGEPDPGTPLRLVGTARVFGEPHEQHIGRLCVAKDARGNGIATKIMEQALEVCRERAAALDPTTSTPIVTLNSQVRARTFYEKLGFTSEGETFQEAGIDHIRMVLTL